MVLLFALENPLRINDYLPTLARYPGFNPHKPEQVHDVLRIRGWSTWTSKVFGTRISVGVDVKGNCADESLGQIFSILR